ncbi:hypothetical protein XELAEV_18031009mg [Xenopus laevis]|uniref:Uncharacterized protein n=1 Tax=Xenopus laevis TaxID=8355 RepID=A0A974CN08_XENLA|nr:hypothetical protein XELAEV_18031009mg [Xenopus laevis]
MCHSLFSFFKNLKGNYDCNAGYSNTLHVVGISMVIGTIISLQCGIRTSIGISLIVCNEIILFLLFICGLLKPLLCFLCSYSICLGY